MPFVKELSEEFPEITFAKFDTTGKLGWWAHPFSRGEPPLLFFFCPQAFASARPVLRRCWCAPIASLAFGLRFKNGVRDVWAFLGRSSMPETHHRHPGSCDACSIRTFHGGDAVSISPTLLTDHPPASCLDLECRAVLFRGGDIRAIRGPGRRSAPGLQVLQGRGGGGGAGDGLQEEAAPSGGGELAEKGLSFV